VIRRSLVRWTLFLTLPAVPRIVLYVNVYALLRKLDPETPRKLGPDLALNLGTLRGLELFLPGLLMAELRDAARTREIKTVSLAMFFYLGQAALAAGSIATVFLMRSLSGFGALPWACAPVLVALWVASAALEAHCFLTPMNAIVDALDTGAADAVPPVDAGQDILGSAGEVRKYSAT
jgi:hypothetical protein